MKEGPFVVKLGTDCEENFYIDGRADGRIPPDTCRAVAAQAPEHKQAPFHPVGGGVARAYP